MREANSSAVVGGIGDMVRETDIRPHRFHQRHARTETDSGRDRPRTAGLGGYHHPGRQLRPDARYCEAPELANVRSRFVPHCKRALHGNSIVVNHREFGLGLSFWLRRVGYFSTVRPPEDWVRELPHFQRKRPTAGAWLHRILQSTF